MRFLKKITIILAIISAHLLPAFAQRETGELNVLLDSVDITASRNAQSVRTMSDGSVRLNLDMLDKLPKIMGNADPISYSRMLPGVQTSGEYNGGLHINGSENSHNTISVLDVPLFNVNHLLGFFSTFIPTHYSSMSLKGIGRYNYRSYIVTGNGQGAHRQKVPFDRIIEGLVHQPFIFFMAGCGRIGPELLVL